MQHEIYLLADNIYNILTAMDIIGKRILIMLPLHNFENADEWRIKAVIARSHYLQPSNISRMFVDN